MASLPKAADSGLVLLPWQPSSAITLESTRMKNSPRILNSAPLSAALASESGGEKNGKAGCNAHGTYGLQPTGLAVPASDLIVIRIGSGKSATAQWPNSSVDGWLSRRQPDVRPL